MTSKPINIPRRSGSVSSVSSFCSSPPINTWVDDRAVSVCANCNDSFSLFKRRHHCRLCGRVFCASCTPHYDSIPECLHKMIPQSPPTYTGYFVQALAGSSSPKDKKRRLCEACYCKIQDQKHNQRLSQILELVMNQWFQLNDFEMMRVSCVSRNWNVVGRLAREQFHKLCHTKLITDDSFKVYQHIVRGNATLICQSFPHIIPCIIRSLRKDGNPRLSIGIDRIRMNLETSLQILGIYDPRWTTQMSADFLPPTDTYSRVNEIMVEAAQSFLLKSSSCSIRPVLTRICFLGDEDTLRLLLLSRSPELSFRMYWILRVYRPQLTHVVAKSAIQHEIRKSLSVIQLIENLSKAKTCEDHKRIEISWKRAARILPAIRFPGLYNFVVVSVVWKDIARIRSNSNPLVIPFVLQDTVTKKKKTVSVLFKQESVLKDTVMMECLQQIRQLLRNEYPLICYSVVPISFASGLVIMVPRSKTLYGITRKGLSLQNYLLEHNPNMTVHDLRDRFVRSCAVCCVQSMLFGLGDRHLENILLSEQGTLFHVDYGYIFGQEPSGQKMIRQRNCMKLTPNIVDIMGGQKSRYFAMFRKKTFDICVKLRQYVNLFSQICSPLIVTGGVSDSLFHSHLYATFRPGQTVKESHIEIQHIIEYNTKHRILDSLMDKIHTAYDQLF